MNKYPIVLKKVQNVIHVDGLVSGGTNLAEVKNLKQKPIELFSKGSFNLHKWHSNIYHRLIMIAQIVNKLTPNNYSVVILIIQKC